MEHKRRLNCMRCNAVMSSERVGDISVDVCPDCGGIWLDKGELSQIVRERIEDAEVDERLLWKEADKFKGRLSEIICPHCGSRMVEMRHGPDGPAIDICAGCGGVFLDKDELGAILKQAAKAKGEEHAVTSALTSNSSSLASALGYADHKIEDALLNLGITLQVHHPYITGIIESLNKALGG